MSKNGVSGIYNTKYTSRPVNKTTRDGCGKGKGGGGSKKGGGSSKKGSKAQIVKETGKCSQESSNGEKVAECLEAGHRIIFIKKDGVMLFFGGFDANGSEQLVCKSKAVCVNLATAQKIKNKCYPNYAQVEIESAMKT